MDAETKEALGRITTELHRLRGEVRTEFTFLRTALARQEGNIGALQHAAVSSVMAVLIAETPTNMQRYRGRWNATTGGSEMKGAGFIVVCLENPWPQVRERGFAEHETLESAVNQAKDLARCAPRKTFVVYEAVVSAKMRDPVEVTDVRKHPEDGEIPF